MSAISESVRAGIYGALNVVGVTNLAPVYYEIAPKNARTPYLVFNRQAPGRPVRTFGQTLIAEDDLWLVKAYAESGTGSARSLIEAILLAAETALQSFSITNQTWLVERYQDLPLPSETIGDRTVFAGGFLLRVVVTP